MLKSAPVHFKCPNCDALYHLVKIEAEPDTIDRWVTCRVCSGPLPAHEGGFALKYFLLRKAGRRQRQHAKMFGANSALSLCCILTAEEADWPNKSAQGYCTEGATTIPTTLIRLCLLRDSQATIRMRASARRFPVQRGKQ